MITFLSLFVESCKKKASTPAPVTQTPLTTITAKYYFQATINGTVVTFHDGIGGYSSGAADESATTSIGYQEVQTGELTMPFSTKSIGGFDIIKPIQALILIVISLMLCLV